jgi:hypothetical protein
MLREIDALTRAVHRGRRGRTTVRGIQVSNNHWALGRRG